MNYALVAYPLSREYRKNLEALLGFTPVYLTVAELRRDPFPKLLRRLLSLRADTLVLPLEDAASRSLLPVLCGFAAVIGARRTEIINPDHSRNSLSRLSALRALGSALTASVGGLVSVRRCDRELDRLLQAPQQQVSLGHGSVAYLKTNLWFGVKAGGSVGHIAGVINGILRRGHRLRFFGTEPPVMVNADAEIDLVSPPSVYGAPSEVNLYRFHKIFATAVRPRLKSVPVSMIYQRLSVGNYVGPVLARDLGVPLVIEYNGSEAWVQKNWGRPLRYHDLAVKAEEACLRHAHVIVTVSDVLRDELVERGIPPERIATYPNCIEPAVFNPERFSTDERQALRRSYGIGDDALLVTFIGTFGQWHGVDILAEAIRRLVDESGGVLDATNAHFMLVGDGLKFSEVQARLSEEPYKRYVTLTGLVPQDQAPLHLAASDILASPHVPNADGSRFFGSPTKLFEYMAMGKPIIASDLDQIGDIFRGSPHVADLRDAKDLPEAATAVLAKPGDVADLADGIAMLLNRQDWHGTLGERARAEALGRYTWDHHVDHIFKVLDAVLEKGVA